MTSKNESTNDFAPRCVIIGHPSESYFHAFRQLVPKVRVYRCLDGKSLARAAETQVPDLIVMELRLADGPTTKVIHSFRERFPNARIVVVTNHGSVASAVHCLKLGIDRYYCTQVPVEYLLGEQGLGADHDLPERPICLERATWEYLNRVVDHTGSITVAAKLLGLDRRSLRRMLGRYAPPP